MDAGCSVWAGGLGMARLALRGRKAGADFVFGQTSHSHLPVSPEAAEA
jgi:hypothetical protein